MALGGVVFASVPESVPTSPVAGVVKHLQTPVPGALVFVYGVSDATLNRMNTAQDGSFAFQAIPAGIYDVVAYKTGYYPSLIRLWHQSSPNTSILAIDLVPEAPLAPTKKVSDVWTWREHLPADVLREMNFDGGERSTPSVTGIQLNKLVNGDFASSQNFGGGGDSSLNRSQMNLYGGLPGGVQYGLQGSYSSLQGNGQPLSTGNATDLSLTLADSPDSAAAATFARRMFDSVTPGREDPTWDAEAMRWNTKGESGQEGSVSVVRSADSGFEQAISPLPTLFPAVLRAYGLAGSWSQESDTLRYSASLQLRRREYSATDDKTIIGTSQEGLLSLTGEKQIFQSLVIGARVMGRSGGDGTSVCPGGLVRLSLLPGTALIVSASHRVGSSQAPVFSGPPVVVSEQPLENLANSEESVTLSLGGEPTGTVQVTASRQTIGEPVVAVFDSDLLVDLGSLYLFDGNQLQRISGTASARLFEVLDAALTAESGRLDGKVTGETQDRFSVTSSAGTYYRGQAAVTIRPTRTSVSCALRRIRQVLQTNSGVADNFSDLVRVSLGQDLSVLGFYPFGTAWRVLVSYETDNTNLASDATIEETASLRRRLMGGLSINF
jgi:hypothetical protein